MWLNSFMSWIGGKKALRELIVTLFPVYYERYIEVFGGGGWVLFHKPPGNDFEVYNDFNSLLVNLYRCVRDKPQELMESLRYVLNAREDFDAVRAALARDSPASDVQKAAWFYQLIRYSYASGLTSFGSQPHDMRSNFPLIEQAHRRLATVAYILTNISYTGDMIWQKSCATDTIPFRQVRNLGQKPRYFVEHSHPAIVSCADFQRVQELMSSRKGQFHGTHRISKGSLYDKHIYCGGCGSLCRKKITVGKTYWVCRRHDGNKADCPTPQIPEPEITAAVLRLYHKLKLGQETVLRPVLSQLQELRERELRSNRKISDIDNEIARISEQNLVLVRLKSKGYVDSALYLSQMDEIDRKLRELRKLRRRLLEAAGEDRQIHDTERMMEYLEDGPEWLDEVPAELFGELIERIIIISPERLKFRLLNGMELAENIERTVR